MKPTRSPLQSNWFWAGLALLLAAGLKLALALADRFPFNADEAIVALMARHILQGARPIFFYGQAYMGSLDAFLAAAGFAIFGQQIWVIRLIQGLLYLGVLATTGLLGRQAFGSPRVGALAMLLLAIPVVNVTLYTTISLGGYGEALLLGNVSLCLGLHLAGQMRQGGSGRWYEWLLLGLLTGLGLWAFGLALVFSLPVLIYLLWLSFPAASEVGQSLDQRLGAAARRTGPYWLALALGGLIGAWPWLAYALQHGLGQLLQELGGGAIAGTEQMPWIFRVGKHLMGLLLLGSTVTLGFRPPWSADWLGLPLLPFVLMLWMAVIAFLLRALGHPGPYRQAQALLAGVMATLLAAFVLSPFGADPSGRYFVPLAIPLALFAAAAIEHWRARWGQKAYTLAALLLIYSLWGTLQCTVRFPPGLTTQFYTPSQVDMRYIDELQAFLRQEGETRGYSNYWVAYPLAFLSGEELIFTPRLPYHLDFAHTERDNRYRPYNELIAQAGRVAYITTHHPDLDAYLRSEFTRLGVTWQENRLGDFQVFYRLSRPVRPEEMNLGRNSPAWTK